MTGLIWVLAHTGGRNNPNWTCIGPNGLTMGGRRDRFRFCKCGNTETPAGECIITQPFTPGESAILNVVMPFLQKRVCILDNVCQTYMSRRI